MGVGGPPGGDQRRQGGLRGGSEAGRVGVRVAFQLGRRRDDLGKEGLKERWQKCI